MKKSLIYLFSLLCMLTLVTSCSDDEKGMKRVEQMMHGKKFLKTIHLINFLSELFQHQERSQSMLLLQIKQQSF